MIYDPADPRIWLPKASGLGWTLNFAHPISWLIIGALAVVVVVAAYYKYRRRR
jgi:uncharacterized membrane protein